MYKKLRNFGTIPLGVTNLVSKCAENSKEYCQSVVARALPVAELCELSRGGGHDGPPVLLGLSHYQKILTNLGSRNVKE